MYKIYQTCFGPINLSNRTLNGFQFQDDVWRRALRLQLKYGRNRFDYLADYYEFKRV